MAGVAEVARKIGKGGHCHWFSRGVLETHPEELLAYYDVVIAELRVDVLADAASNLEEAARVLDRREAAGSASGYESTRFAIATQLGASRLAEARGVLASARARLGALLGVPSGWSIAATELELIAPGAEDAIVADRGASRPAIARARESVRLADQAEDRAGWAWVPAIELGAGMKRANDSGADDGHGYVVGVSLDIPLFDHGQAERERAGAQRALATARSQALARRIDADVESALAVFRSARDELARFESRTTAEVDALLVAAQSGYREGERTIVELLDAQRARTDVAERRLELLASAKRAEGRLRAAAGDLR